MPRIKMTPEQIELDKSVLEMRRQNIGFKVIAEHHGLSKSKLQAIYTRLGIYQKPTKEQSAQKRKMTRKAVQFLDKPKKERKCRLCGKNPAPNWFYCPSCHTKASEYVWGIDDDQDHRLNLGKVKGATISKPMGA